jgi:tetratricopeptide (TPR) repeat protein
MRMQATALRPLLTSLAAALLLAGVPARGASANGFVPSVVAASAAPWFGAAPLAQASEAELRAEISFARGLAADWGFVDLAQEVITRLEGSRLPSAIGEEVSLLKCEVYFAAARTDAKNREKLLKQAIDAYAEFLARSSFTDESKASAEAGLVEASSAYARTLAGRLEDALGDEQALLRDEIQKVLSAASQRASELVRGYKSIPAEERTDAQKRKMYELLLAQGEMLLELGKAQELGAANFTYAAQAFEELSTEPGEGSPWSMRGLIGLGDVYATQGKWEEAAAFYEFPVNFSIPIDPAAWSEASQEMSREEKQARFLFVQLGTPGLVKSLLAQGDEGAQQAAINWNLHLYNTWRREGLDLVQPQGYIALLDVARTLVDIGGVIGGNTAAGEAKWFRTSEEAVAQNVPKRSQRTALDFALSLAQTVANDNKGTNLLVRAQQVIGEIISRPGVQVDPSVLFDAAQGDFNANEFTAAIPAFKRVMLALEGADEAARAEMMPKLLWHIGRSFARMDRMLEAAVTYEAALDSWTGDAVWDEQNATGFNSALSALKRQAKGDAQIEAMVRKSEELLARFSGGAANDILFRSAEAAFDAKKYDEARQKYKNVTAGNNFEKAIVALGLCDYREGKFDAAIKAFSDYTTQYVPDAKNATTDPQKLAKRKEARASAEFYWGLSLYKLAEQGKGDFQAVIAKLGKYHEEFPEQTRFAPAALYQTLMAHVKLGEQAKVRAVLETMLTKFPDDQFTGNAAKESYVALETKRNAETDEAKRTALLREMAENLQVLNRTSPKPSFPNMRRESQHWMELREWATAEELLKRIQTQFATDTSVEEIMLKGVLPDLGDALARQYKVQEAAEVLIPLNAKEAKFRATKNTATNYAHVLAGWVEMTRTPDGKLGSPKEVPGVGGAENFGKAAEVINQLAGSAEKWTTEWFQYKFDQIYCFHQWSKLDSKNAEITKREIGFLANPTNLGPQFRHDQMPEDLRQLYVWLLAQVGR